jgi:hypothetical protein
MYVLQKNDSRYIELCSQFCCFEVVPKIKYLGIEILDTLNFDAQIERKFKEVQKSFAALYNYGTRPHGLNPHAKAHISNTYCLPKGLYGIGCITIKSSMLKKT